MMSPPPGEQEDSALASGRCPLIKRVENESRENFRAHVSDVTNAATSSTRWILFPRNVNR